MKILIILLVIFVVICLCAIAAPIILICFCKKKKSHKKEEDKKSESDEEIEPKPKVSNRRNLPKTKSEAIPSKGLDLIPERSEKSDGGMLNQLDSELSPKEPTPTNAAPDKEMVEPVV